MKLVHLKPLLTSALFIAVHLPHPSAAASDLDAVQRDLAHFPNVTLTKERLHPSDILRHKNVRHLALQPDQREKARRLYKKILSQPKIDASAFTLKDVEALVRLVDTLEATGLAKDWLSSRQSLYLHKEKNFLKLSLQFYHDGKIFIYFRSQDQSRVKGHSKEFSRSLEYTSERFFAHLVVPLSDRNHSHLTLRELQAMGELAKHEDAVHCVDASLYWAEAHKGERSPERHQHRLRELFQELFHGHKKASRVTSDFELRACIEEELYDSDLFSYVHNGGPLHWPELLRVSRLAAAALAHMHNAGLVHRDIKPENFLVREHAGTLQVAIGDFEFFEDQSLAHACDFVGTPFFIAPEICTHQLESPGASLFHSLEDAKKADIFALGLVFLELFSRNTAKPLEESAARLVKIVTERRKRASPRQPIEAPSQDRLKALLAEYKASYDRSLNQQQALSRLEQRAADFYGLALAMAHPSPNERPSLARVDKALVELEGELSEQACLESPGALLTDLL